MKNTFAKFFLADGDYTWLLKNLLSCHDGNATFGDTSHDDNATFSERSQLEEMP